MEALMTKDKKVQGTNLSFAKTVAYGGDGMNQDHGKTRYVTFLERVIMLHMD